MNKQRTRFFSLLTYTIHYVVVGAIIIDACCIRIIPDTIDRIFYVDSVVRFSRLLTWLVLSIRAFFLWNERATPQSNPREYITISLILIAEVALMAFSRLLVVQGPYTATWYRIKQITENTADILILSFMLYTIATLCVFLVDYFLYCALNT